MWRYLGLRRSAGLLGVPVSIALAVLVLLSPDTDWQYEWGRALNAAGLYLFISSPLFAGLAAFDTVRQRRRSATLLEGLPDRRLADHVPWLSTALIGSGVHVVVVAAISVAAWRSDAVGHPYLSTTVVQFLSVFAFAALGGLTGSVTTSLLVPPALALVCIGLNVLMPTGPFRSVAAVGTGQVDLIGVRPDPRHEVVQSIVFGLLILAAVPLRPIGKRVRVVGTGAAVGAAVAVALVLANAPSLLTPAAYKRTCASGAVRLCGPIALTPYFPYLGSALARVQGLLIQSGVTAPAGYEIVPAGHLPSGDYHVLLADTEIIRNVEQRWAAARQALVGGLPCDIGRTNPPHESVILARAALDGWLQEALGDPVPGTYPSDAVAKLNSLPTADRNATIKGLYDAVNSCASQVDAMAKLLS